MNVIQALNLSEHSYEECLKCSICTAYCPVSAVEPKYPGPKHSGPDLERYRLKDPMYRWAILSKLHALNTVHIVQVCAIVFSLTPISWVL